MTLMNRLGFSVSYDSIQRIDTSLALRIIEQAGSNRVPVLFMDQWIILIKTMARREAMIQF